MAQRALKTEEPTEKAPTELTQAGSMHTERPVKTSQGTYTEVPDQFDMALLDSFKPYREGDKLPQPVVGVNKKGTRFLKKLAEPRFYFQGNDFLKVQQGINGKKVSLFWTFKQVGKPETSQRDSLHRRIRAHFRKKGIPGA